MQENGDINYIEFLDSVFSIMEEYVKDNKIVPEDTMPLLDWISEFNNYCGFIEEEDEYNDDISLTFCKNTSSIKLDCDDNVNEDDFKKFVGFILSEKNILNIIMQKIQKSQRPLKSVLYETIKFFVEHDSVVKPSEVMINATTR